MSVADRFREVFGRGPEAVWHAPGRVNLIGEHTDYNDGLVLPFALPQGVSAAAARSEGGWLRIASAQRPDELVERRVADLAPGSVDGWAAYPAGVVWSLREAGSAVGGAELLLDGTLPDGAGLSSSAAVECSVGMALDELYRLGLERPVLAELAQAAEERFVGMPCGLMDQFASLLCTDGHLLCLDTRSRAVRQVPLAPADLTLVLVDTASPHRLVSGEYAARRRDCERAAAELGVTSLREVTAEGLDAALLRLGDERLRARVRHVVTENTRVLRVVESLDQGRPEAVGHLLTGSHESLRVDFEVSSLEQDLAVRAALDAGASGARMTGGGFGGSVIALVPAAVTDTVVSAVLAAFAGAGLATPTCTEVRPSEGARRLGP